MENYYAKNLSAWRLKRVYEIGSPRLKQYLESEIQYILDKTKPTDTVIEIGCGYGRIPERIAVKAKKVVGIDIAEENIKLGKELLSKFDNVELYQMDAGNMDLPDATFDLVVIAQNGISAFKVPPENLLKECLRIAKKSGIILLSTYSSKFWNDRVEWFKKQSEEGLLGEIDWDKTKDGVIICKDGFKATTFSPDDFNFLTAKFNITPNITEIDESSLFCEIVVP